MFLKAWNRTQMQLIQDQREIVRLVYIVTTIKTDWTESLARRPFAKIKQPYRFKALKIHQAAPIRSTAFELIIWSKPIVYRRHIRQADRPSIAFYTDIPLLFLKTDGLIWQFYHKSARSLHLCRFPKGSHQSITQVHAVGEDQPTHRPRHFRRGEDCGRQRAFL